MSRSIQAQAACLLLLILASLASSSVLQRQTRQPTDLQTLDTAEAQTGLMPRLHRLWRRDTYIPVCIFCCKCCHNRQCGICCRT
ncbi:hepcidin [Erinaceus europaeus]|uniref:Hepcidin n=1 Tax=Erinaceus europaeus TaxID=9365 RepID=A0A1S3ARR1_ERIEU|nr:hepcidin [Erinaceus europaeus]